MVVLKNIWGIIYQQVGHNSQGNLVGSIYRYDTEFKRITRHFKKQFNKNDKSYWNK
jgi:hypothetical protein